MTPSSRGAPKVAAASDLAPFSRLPSVLAPHANLLIYYVLTALLTGPALLVLLPLRYFRFQTLRYTLDEEGINVRWGILFRRETSLTYARIQDIHLSSNVLERWLGLAKVQIQTASGNSHAEITIEGLTAFEAMRDFLYSRMRGAKETVRPAVQSDAAALTAALREVAAEVRALRLGLGSGSAPEKKDV